MICVGSIDRGCIIGGLGPKTAEMGVGRVPLGLSRA